MVVSEERHSGTRHFGPLFEYGHLPEGALRNTSAHMSCVAQYMIATLPDGPELTAGLRKLLEAKDCFVRASLTQ